MNDNEIEDSTSKWNAELEFIQITDKSDFIYQKYGKIKVYGGGEDGIKRESNPPHFHIEMKNDEEIQVSIPSKLDGELKTITGELFNQIIGHFIAQEQRGIITEDEFYKRMYQFNSFEEEVRNNIKYPIVDIDL